MHSSLPDEILSEILSPALRVSDAAFSHFSAYLVVSKSWLRVATPLLYNVVILRLKAQAQALAATLTANPALGQFIKKLRVEGGYAMSMLKVLQASENITYLFLTLDVAPSDNASDLASSGRSQKLLETLQGCFAAWENMAVLEMPHADKDKVRDEYEPDTEEIITEALRAAPNVRTLVVWDIYSALLYVPSYMGTAATNASLKHIQIRPLPQSWYSQSSGSQIFPEDFADQLARQPSLGLSVRSLFFEYEKDTALFENIIAHTPALTSLHCKGSKSISWTAFCDLSEFTGSTLRFFRGIRISKASGAVSPEVFDRGTQMERIHWLSPAEFMTDSNLTRATAFQHARESDGRFISRVFMEVLAHMELPSLRSAAFFPTSRGGASFFRKHGAKLREVTVSESQINDSKIAFWLGCPAITHPVGESCLTTDDTHTHVRRIVFMEHSDHELKQRDRAQLGRLLAALRTTASIPALREIEHPLCKWPTNEHETSSSSWVKWAESMLERDVHLWTGQATLAAASEVRAQDEAKMNRIGGISL
ncbi:F-box domain-containing protein [Mycena sanguinolenta]|uniref:F-box domain-containing protein n=1 Tax=Mycena sanguinolenta TaxID=230812 RepID=A0A8H6X8L9_9AGAR|nr:F-box domain-containing protein [Mycena sanguinolenta]